MKKLLSAILCAALCASVLAGCSKNGEDDPADTTATQTTTDVSDFSYSEALDDNGRYKGVTASEVVTLGTYFGIEIPESESTATDTEIQKSLDSLLSNYAETKQVKDRAVVKDDQVNIDYVGSVDGVEFSGGNTQGQGTTVTAGASNYIDDFLTQIIGHKPGETIDVNVTFPDPYPNDQSLAGKDALFVTTINYIEEKVTPELTDAFAAEKLAPGYGWKTVAETKAGVEKMVVDAKVSAYIRDKVIEDAAVENIPDSVYESQKRMMLSYYNNAAAQYNMTFADYLKAMGFDSETQLITQNDQGMRDKAKEYLVLQAIAEKENITVSDDDIKNYLANYSDGFDPEKFDDYVKFYGRGYLAQIAFNEIVYETVEEKAVRK